MTWGLRRQARLWILTLGLGWMLATGGMAYAQAQRLAADIERVTAQVGQLDREQRGYVVQVEQRLTRMETQLAGLIETQKTLIYGVVGAFGSQIAAAIWAAFTKRSRT